jgi:predicted MFS family arabinose efflux permease
MAGMLVSTIGSWMQNAAVPYALYSITGSATWVGLAGVAMFLPSVPLAPVAGALADRCDRRRVLLGSQAVQFVSALGLWLTWAHWPRPGLLLVFVAIGGTAMLVTAATHQAFISELVTGDELLGALTINSAQANVARAVGPSLGGLVIATVGPGLVFGINSVSFIVVVAALLRIRVPRRPRTASNVGVARAFCDAAGFAARDPLIAPALVLTVVIGGAVYPINQMAVIMARTEFDVGAGLFGVLSGAFGAGALLGAFALGWFQRRHPSRDAVVVGFGVTGLALLGYGAAPFFVLAVLCCAMVGAGALVVTALLNTRIQRTTPHEMRGSVLAVWVVSYNVAFAAGALGMGRLADRSGVRAPLLIAGVIVCAATSWFVVHQARRPAVFAP